MSLPPSCSEFHSSLPDPATVPLVKPALLAKPAPVLKADHGVAAPGIVADQGEARESHAGAGFFCRQLADRLRALPAPWQVLVAGCGAGHEAVAVQRQLGARVEAVDVQDFVATELKQTSPVRFQVASVCELPFAAAQFDAIFYHHVIEHVDSPTASLTELHRVLRPGGWLFVGTPNRHRLVSSVGAHQQSEWEATWVNKLGDNLRDWRDRLTGRFRNELGAHAGFSQRELDQMLATHFARRDWVTDDYLRFKYGGSKVRNLLPLVTHPAVQWFAAPAIYVFAGKRRQDEPLPLPADR